MRVAIIPARGGSKRIPRKNIKYFHGKPMIGWSIEVSISSGLFDRIIVSTEDEEIASISKKFGAEVPYLRCKNLADDLTGTTDVICDAIKQLNLGGFYPTEVCCIYPAAPFIRTSDLQLGLANLQISGVDYSFPVSAFRSPIQRAIKITANNRVQMFDELQYLKRSQDLEPAYYDAGQFYWGMSDSWLSNKPLFTQTSAPLILPMHRVHDIDTEEDWRLAEIMFEVMQKYEI